MKKGIIKKYNPVKGYGFIQAEEDMKKDIFFHCTQLCDTDAGLIREGQEVEFELVEHQRGPQARRVRKIGSR
ncbi:MAG TPA: cold shock domain-containing protein [Candidatus Fimiplasma intestinipullorum]|uniref:Cold shock domain-containing protein n=1 Tax=Candidatus Fimiplasma intestinipullorum TaxID=2840825 RepID=A0A9D1L1S7_9FIRM|nr:cold shock domain-containing protein [Candidatus Fimiplasma intestinipullorum]